MPPLTQASLRGEGKLVPEVASVPLQRILRSSDQTDPRHFQIQQKLPSTELIGAHVLGVLSPGSCVLGKLLVALAGGAVPVISVWLFRSSNGVLSESLDRDLSP